MTDDPISGRRRAGLPFIPVPARLAALAAAALLGASDAAQAQEPTVTPLEEPAGTDTTCPTDPTTATELPADCPDPPPDEPHPPSDSGTRPDRVSQPNPKPDFTTPDSDPEPDRDSKPGSDQVSDGRPDGGGVSAEGGLQTGPATPPGGYPHNNLAGVAGSPYSATGSYPFPPFLLPMYESCGRRYGIPWSVLAAINQVETNFGTNLNVSSAGAVGWMQFLPSTWSSYGLDANRDGLRNPYDPEDAICAAASYLEASGARQDLPRALYAYNHADWYVDMVLDLAQQYESLDLHDPLPPAERLSRAFARSLVQIAADHHVDWAVVLAVVRAQGGIGHNPATLPELGAIAQRVAAAQEGGPRTKAGVLIHSLFSKRPAFEDKVDALTAYNRAVGIRGLVEGLFSDAARERLGLRALESNRLLIYSGGREDIKNDLINARVLTVMLYLAERHGEITVTSLTSGHGYYARPGVPSAHAFGRAVDIAAINGVPILGNQQAGGVTESAVRELVALPAEVRPTQVISLFSLGGPSFAAADHHDHIHVGF